MFFVGILFFFFFQKSNLRKTDEDKLLSYVCFLAFSFETNNQSLALVSIFRFQKFKKHP